MAVDSGALASSLVAGVTLGQAASNVGAEGKPAPTSSNTIPNILRAGGKKMHFGAAAPVSAVAAGSAGGALTDAPVPSMPVDSVAAAAAAAHASGESPLHSDLRMWKNKPYLGGYKDRRNGMEYFHSTTQTPTAHELRNLHLPTRYSRECQTKFTRHRPTQCESENSTQMNAQGVFISEEGDRVKEPRPYVTSEAHFGQVQHAVIKIQSFFRCCLAKKESNRIRAFMVEKKRRDVEQERKRVLVAEKRRIKELESRLHPKTAKDFEVLYSGLENWRVQESARIQKAGYSEAARLTALADLLDQESALIQKIDRLKIAANEENYERGVLKLLEAMAAPKKWKAGHVGYASVDTPNIIRARELKELFTALHLPLISVDERLQILLHVKYTVKEFDCQLTRDIVDLIDREGDLISRGRDAASIEGLRKRISTLFLQFIKTPEFNPEAGHFQKFPAAASAFKKDQAVYFCRGCTNYLPSTSFYLSTTMKHLGRCKNCTIRENIATSRKDDSSYFKLLKNVRARENEKLEQANGAGRPSPLQSQSQQQPKHLIDFLQESDIRYLVDSIWNRSSAVSGLHPIEELILTRWNAKEEFSPWNCVLLDRSEAKNHDAHPNPISMYSEEFVAKIAQRHLLARAYFADFPEISGASGEGLGTYAAKK